MLRKIVLSLPLLALTMVPGSGFAQSQDASKAPESKKFYKLEFVVKEVEGGKVLNARAYSATVSTDLRDGPTQIRAGSKVPYQTTVGESKNLQYLDVGVNIDCRSIREMESGLSLFVSATINGVPSDIAVPSGPPTVRQNSWSSSVIVPLKKPTLLFSSDDPASKRQMQLELTATPIT
jgi:hypothetical protein